jgi:RNA ligase
MDNFSFPRIKNINDILPFIKDKEEIIVVNKEYNGTKFTVIDYVFSKEDTFDSPYARECRGIVFNKNGDIIRRPYHKFHNVNENPQSHYTKIDLNNEHSILEKLDGSLIVPFLLDNGTIYYGTRLCSEEYHNKVSNFVTGSYCRYELLIRFLIKRGFSPQFEYIGPDNKIVVNYHSNNLILTGIRHMLTGMYLSYDRMLDIGISYNVPVVNNKHNREDIFNFLSKVRAEEEGEGYIIRFSLGEMYKIKNDLYCRLHKSKDLITRTYEIVHLILDGKIDDLISSLSEEDQKYVRSVEEKVWQFHHNLLMKLSEHVLWANTAFETVKDYALYDKKFSKEDEWIEAATFKALKGKQLFSIVTEYMLRNGSRQSDFNNFYGDYFNE